jgi:hypothetical protein
MGGIGVLNCGNNEVLVGEGTGSKVDVEPGTLVSGNDVGTSKKGVGVRVRGCRRYDPVIAIVVRVALAFCASASLAGPPDATQKISSRATNRPVTPNACK